MVYDLLMLCLLAMTTLRGSAKGIAWQLAGIATLVLCFLFSTPLSAAIAPHVPLQPPLNRWTAMLAAYLAFSFACFSVARGFRGFLETSRFEEFDKHLGALFGFIKGVTLCFVITFFAVCLSDSAAGYILETKTGYVSTQIMQQIQPVLPAELQNVLRRAAGQPLLEQGPFEIGQGQPPQTDPLADGRSSAPPLSGNLSDDEWSQSDNSLGSAPRFQSSNPQPPSGLPPTNPNSAAPNARARFFGTSPGAPAGTSAPAGGGLLDNVQPLFGTGSGAGNGLANQALSALKGLLPGAAQPTPVPPQPSSVAPMSGTALPSPNLNSPPSAARVPAFNDDDLSFGPSNSPPGVPRVNSAPPVGNAGLPSRFDDDPFPGPANSTTQTGRPGATIPPRPGFADSDPRRTDFGNNPSVAGTPRPSRLGDDDGFVAPRTSPPVSSNERPLGNPSLAPRPDSFPSRSQPPIGSRNVDDDLLPPARSNASINTAPRPGDFSRNPDDDLTPRRPLNSSGVAPAPDRLPLRRTFETDVPRSAPASLSRVNRPNDGFPSGPTAPMPNFREAGQSRSRNANGGKPVDRTEEIQTLTAGIAVLLSSPAQRPVQEAEIRRAMQGLTQRTVSHVLRDWQADLLGTGNDPNPQTDVSTPLSERIASRLAYEQQKAGGRGSSQPPRPR